ncbi:MAG: PilZ domain-containing protein [Candidatus Zixiibacteriota bacterium]|nr:MAG: PilZ domain-containing protein [candidate division Zixibacteria bacterium]
MKERRKEKRQHLNSYVAVYDRTTGDHIGCLVDMTTEGIKVMSNKPFDPDSDVKLRVSIPFEISGGKTITFDAKCRWCNKKDNPDLYEIGFQTTCVSPTTSETIKNLIASPLFKSTLKFAAKD